MKNVWNVILCAMVLCVVGQVSAYTIPSRVTVFENGQTIGGVT